MTVNKNNQKGNVNKKNANEKGNRNTNILKEDKITIKKKSKDKRKFDDTKIEIPGEYNKFEYISKINKKKLIAFTFCYNKNNIITKFLFKNESKTREFYNCYKSGKGCNGKAFYGKLTQKFNVYKECDFTIEHEDINYEKFEEKCNNNSLNDIDISIKKYQRYYIRYLFKNKKAIDKYNAINIFKEKFGDKINFILDDNDINVEKSKNVPNPKDKTLFDLINILANENKDIIVKKTDMIYDYKFYDKSEKKTKTIKREQEAIFFGTKDMYNELNNKDNRQFFIDVTYKIIPYKYHPYKLLTIKAFNNQSKNTKLCALVALKFEDVNSFYYTLKYLKEFFKFKPEIINIDFSLSLYKAIKLSDLFGKEVKVILCFFHYTQSIIRKMRLLKIINMKLSKKGFTILLNIQILSF